MSDDTAQPATQQVKKSIGQRRRNARSKSKRKMAVDCLKPIILPQHKILWCSSDNGEAKRWLLVENLPWWFLASFINFCARVLTGNPRSHKVGRKCTVAQKRLLACLEKHPLRDEELVEERKCYATGPAHLEVYKKGLVDVNELKSDENPEIALSRAQEELHRMVFSAEQRESHEVTMDLDCSVAPGPDQEPGEEWLAPPATLHTFALPLRLDSPSSVKWSPGSDKRQHESDAVMAQDREDELRMRLD